MKSSTTLHKVNKSQEKDNKKIGVNGISRVKLQGDIFELWYKVSTNDDRVIFCHC